MINMKKLLRFYKVNGIVYGEGNGTKFAFISIRLNANSDLYISGNKWIVRGRHILPTIVPHVYESVYSFQPKKFNRLQQVDEEFIRVLVVKGKNINVFLDGKIISKYIGINIIKAKDLISFLSNYNLSDYITI